MTCLVQELLYFIHQVWADDQRVKRGCPEALDGVMGRTHDWLSARIERGVDEYGYACPFLKRMNQVVIEWVLLAIDGLGARCTIDMAQGGYAIDLHRPTLEESEHGRARPGM